MSNLIHSDIIIVGGYRADHLPSNQARIVMNENYKTTNMVYSLFCAKSYFDCDFIVSYGDIAYSRRVFKKVLNSSISFGVVIDNDWLNYWKLRFEDPLSDAETLLLNKKREIIEIGQNSRNLSQIQSQYIGMTIFRGKAIDQLKAVYSIAQDANKKGLTPFNCSRDLKNLYMTDLLQGMITNGYNAIEIDGGWVEIDSPQDLVIAQKLSTNGRLD